MSQQIAGNIHFRRSSTLFLLACGFCDVHTGVLGYVHVLAASVDARVVLMTCSLSMFTVHVPALSI